MIRIECIGNCSQDAQVKEFNGKQYICFSLAHNEKYKDQSGQWQDKTTFLSVMKPCANGNTSLVQYLKKGKQVFVAGTPSARTYKDKQNEVQAALNILAMDVQLLGGKNDAQPQQQQAKPQPQQQAQQAPATDVPGELPF